MRETITVLRAPVIIKAGMEKRDWDHAVGTVISNCQITAQATSRVFEGRVEQVTDRRLLRAPYDADIQSGDRIQWEGVLYDIDGEVFHSKSPTGRISSTRCTLVKWEG
jgi:hypothetical protein